MPKPRDITEVVKTNITTSRGFVDLPEIRLVITATNVIRPMLISISPTITIPKCCFNCLPQLFYAFFLAESPITNLVAPSGFGAVFTA